MTKKNDVTYINPFIRGASGAVDIFVVGFLRVIFVQIVGTFVINNQLLKFHEDFNKKFGVMFSAENAQHVQFLTHHSILKIMVVFMIATILVGAFYHAFFNSSTWSATIGKRIFGLVMVKNEGKNLTLGQALNHYFLSLVPWIFMFYILMFMAKNKVTIYEALTGNTANLVVGILMMAWIQVHILTKKKNTVNDMIIGCTMVKGKVGKGWPKFRKKDDKINLQ